MAAAQNQPVPLLIHNLMNDLAELARLLFGELHRGSWLNAYLLAAGMNQIVEDYLYADPYHLGRLAQRLALMRPPFGSLAALSVRGVGLLVAYLRRQQRGTRRLLRWQTDWAAFVQRLAEVVVCSPSTPSKSAEVWLASGEALIATLEYFPARLRRGVLRLPSCFRSFDQRPADLERIVQDFVRRWPNRHKPIVVVGIRTSGSYLAPLGAAFLRAYGYQKVSVLTLRPGRGVPRPARRMVQTLGRRDGLVLVTDDPPASGSSLAKAAEELERVGVPSHSIILLLQLFRAGATLPAALRKYAAILLPEDEWAIQQKLAPSAVQLALAELLGPAITVSRVERLPLPPRRWVRSHVRALYRVEMADQERGDHWEQQVVVKGVGLGYFGEHALAVGQRLRRFVPEIYGVKEGLLYRAWLPEERRLAAPEPGNEEKWAAAVVSYVVARNRSLAVAEDVSLRLSGSGPTWEVSSYLLSQVFGRAAWLMAIPVVDPVVKRLLRVAHPSVIDGNMAWSRWFRQEPEHDSLLKVDFDERAFCNLGLYCYDPIFDLAGLAVSCDQLDRRPELNGWMRRRYESVSGESISAERWLLYQMAHLWNLQQHPLSEPGRVRRALSRALQGYFAEIFFNDSPSTDSGLLCAIDIDGVLETAPLGFPGLTPASALTLRALSQHGYRLVLATGRSLTEVRERCHAYHLAGGVSEYGAVVYNHDTGRVQALLSTAQRAALDRLREVLTEMGGIQLDPDFHYAVRAYCLEPAGQRRGLTPEKVATALAKSDTRGRIRPIVGEAQTDFMVIGIDKGVGLRILVDDLGGHADVIGGKPLAWAVGDTVSDLPVFELATMAFAPAHADSSVRKAGVKVMKRPYQSGLALAASKLLGHPPGGCPTCRAPNFSPETRLLLTLLAAPEMGRWGMIAALLLAARVKKLTRR